MNRYYMIRRLRVPVFLLLLGTMAVLAQMNIFSWSHSWPLILIYFGVMMLVERAVLAMDGYPNAAQNAQTGSGVFSQNAAGVASGTADGINHDSHSAPVSVVTTTESTDSINTGNTKGVQL